MQAQQAATAEILKIIASSPTDIQSVFDAIARNALTLCGSAFATLFRFDGTLMHYVSGHHVAPEQEQLIVQGFPSAPHRGKVAGRAIMEKAVVCIPDILADPEYDHYVAVGGGWRKMFAVPMLRNGDPVGAIAVGWTEPGPIAKSQVALLQTFADQAVIAIENVRLFNELQARTQALAGSVRQLTALAEVGQAINATLDLDRVLQTIVSRAVQLTGLDAGEIFEYDEQAGKFYLRAADKLDARLLEALRRTPVRKGEGAIGRSGLTGKPTEVSEIVDQSYQSRMRDLLLDAGYRALLAVPLLREGNLLGALLVNRKAPGRFPSETISLLENFALQSSLAIQNARLYREIAEKSHLLEAASRHKSEFLANMSHELRTPLNAIIGFSEVLGERYFGELTEKQDEYVRDISESGRHLLSLINDILDLSKIEAGKMNLEPVDFDLPAALRNVLALVKERAQRHGIRLALEVEPALDQIHADELKFKQIMLNLLSNAVKFTPDGGSVSVTATSAGNWVEIAVTDTGAGIAPEDFAAVFEEFKQVGRDQVRKAEGTGLGLPLAKRFVELHGGAIRLASQLGAGSTFSFTLPHVAGHCPEPDLPRA